MLGQQSQKTPALYAALILIVLYFHPSLANPPNFMDTKSYFKFLATFAPLQKPYAQC